MHVNAVRRFRPATRYPARFIGGRRRSRYLHSSARLSLPRRPGPFEPAETALDQTEQNDVSGKSADEDKNLRGVAEVAQGGGQDDHSRRIVEALYARPERSDKNSQKTSKLPELRIPKWFQSRNVKLVEENVDSRPRASYSCALSIRSKEDDHLLATIAIPNTHGDAVRTFEELSSRLGIRSETVVQKPGSDEDVRSIGWSPDFWIEAEIKACIIAGLSTAQPSEHLSFPAARSNIVLHTPVHGGVDFLSGLVKELASTVGADVIQLNAQDIAELGADYLQESEPVLQSIRTLSYDTHQSSQADFGDDAMDDYGEDEGADGITSSHARNTTMVQPVITIDDSRVGTPGPEWAALKDKLQVLRDRLPRLLGAVPLDSKPRAGDFLIGGPISHTGIGGRRQDFQLSFLLAALTNATELKRANHNSPPRRNSLKDPDFFNDTCPPESRVLDMASWTLPNEPDRRTKADFTITPVRDAPRSVVAEQKDRKTIVLVQDFKEMTNTPIGRSIVLKLADIVMERRKKGDNIMIVGVTSAADMAPDLSVSGIRSLQAEQEDGFFRTILVPGPLLASPDQISESETIRTQVQATSQTAEAVADSANEPPHVYEMTNDAWSKADMERSEEINRRHICDMLRRIDPSIRDVAGKLIVSGLRPFLNHQNRNAISRRTLSHEEVHHLCMTALGLRPANARSQSLGHQINMAMTIIRLSDAAKFAWCTTQREYERASDSADASETDQRLDVIKRECNDHERRLLGGLIDRNRIRTTFDDVHAPPESIESLKTLTSLSLLRPDAFKYGVLATDKIPGLLLYGPPGTGKTLLAKAVARESGATVLEVSGSEVNDMYVGEGEKNVKAVFTLARKLSPCVVFIDEADALFRSRSGPGSRTAHREVINQFLREWDGMDDLGVFIMVATNRPFDLDEAVLRRLPRRLLVDLPTEKDRHAILGIHLKEEIRAPDVSLSALAARTPLYSGSDLKNLCVAAALACVREENEIARDAAKNNDDFRYPDKRVLSARHFEKAIAEISASISEDMASLNAIKKFDEQYGDRRGRRKKGGYGFSAAAIDHVKEDLARVRV